MATSAKGGGFKAKLRGNPLLGGHRGREASKFQFDILIERVIGGSSATTDYSIKWCRGVKTASTKHFNPKPKEAAGIDLGHKLSLLCTLYRTKAQDGIEFEPKDSKLCLLSHKDGKKSDKTVGKVHFDLAQFAGVPSASKPHVFDLNAKTKVVTTITCTFIRTSRGTASSCRSGMTGMTGMTMSSGEYDIGGNDDFADLDELAVPTEKDLDDLLSPVSEATWSPAAAAKSTIDQQIPSPRLPDALERNGDTQRVDSKKPWGSEVVSQRSTRLPSFVKNRTKGAVDREKASSPVAKGNDTKEPRSSGLGSTFKSKAKIGNLESEIEKLQQELDETKKEAEKSKVLHQMSEDIIRELREKIEFSSGTASSSDGTKTKELQEQVDHLEKVIATATIDNRRLEETHQSRMATLKSQVDSLERSKNRLEGDNRTVRGQMESLNALRSSSGIDSSSDEARDKLLTELTKLRHEKEILEATIGENSQTISALEARQVESSAAMQGLHSKLVAHEEHSEQIKSTFEELTKMYSDLKDDHTRLQSCYSDALASNKDCPTPNKGKLAEGRSLPGSFSLDKTRLKRKKKVEGEEERGAGTEGHAPNGDSTKEEEIHNLKAELQSKRLALVAAEREKLETQKQTAGLENDLHQAKLKLQQARKEASNVTERLEASKARELDTNERLDSAHEAKIELQAELEAIRQQHNKEICRLRDEKEAEAKKLRQELIEVVSVSSSGDSNAKTKQMEDALAEAAQREDEYEKEILKLTQIMDGLANKLTEAKKAAEEAEENGTEQQESRQSTDVTKSSEAKKGSDADDRGSAAKETCCARSIDPIEDEDELSESQASSSQGNALTRAFTFNRKPQLSEDAPQHGKADEKFISSSNIRKIDLFEKITDGRLLNLLVDTKMKLAVAEEEKVYFATFYLNFVKESFGLNSPTTTLTSFFGIVYDTLHQPFSWPSST